MILAHKILFALKKKFVCLIFRLPRMNNFSGRRHPKTQKFDYKILKIMEWIFSNFSQCAMPVVESHHVLQILEEFAFGDLF